MASVGEKKTVLVVDDAPANLQIVNSILKDDYKIRVATSAAKALVLVKVKPLPDLILLDVVMPEMDGYEVCGILTSTLRRRRSRHTSDFPDRQDRSRRRDERLRYGKLCRLYPQQTFLAAVCKGPGAYPHLMLREAREQLSRTADWR